MTRPRADSDGWLTDPISRDRIIAKTVVSGIREIIGLLRAMRDEQAETRALREENRELRREVHDLWTAVQPHTDSVTPKAVFGYNVCAMEGCALPDGHSGNHRGSMRTT